jgi:membrane carboxypeptidase/penicillin-binding protein PbpC
MFAAVHGEVKVRGTAAIQDMQSYTVQVGQGMNPSRWEEIGQGGMAINNGLLATWQTPLEDGLYAIRLVVVGKDMSVQITAVQVTVDNTTPQVRVTYPAAGTEISLSSSKTITLVAEVSDALGIQQVEWLLDGRSLGEKTAGPFTYRWTAHKGKHTLVVRATDLAGNVSESLPVEFEVK